MDNPFRTKLHAHPDRLAFWLIHSDCVPITWEIDLTNLCQHRCPRCSGGRDNPVQLTKDQAFSAIDQIANLHGKGLIFTGGGEPTLHPNLVECLIRAQSRSLRVGLISNGGCGKVDWDSIVGVCSWVRFSMDAHDSESFIRHHGVRSWEVLLREITRCVDAKIRTSSECVIGVGYLTDIESQKHMEEATILARILGVDYIQFRPYLDIKGSTILHDINHFVGALSECRKYQTETFKIFCSEQKYKALFEDKIQRTYLKCWGASFASTITADFKVYFCCHTRGQNQWCLGDLNENTLSEIWDSDKRRLVFENSLEGCPPLCRCDDMNRFLDSLKSTVTHPEFL